MKVKPIRQTIDKYSTAAAICLIAGGIGAYSSARMQGKLEEKLEQNLEPKVILETKKEIWHTANYLSMNLSGIGFGMGLCAYAVRGKLPQKKEKKDKK